MTTMHIHHPQGASEVTVLHASRLERLAGKTVALLSDDMWQAHRMLPLVRERLAAAVPDITFLPETEFPMGSSAIDSEAAIDAVIERGADAVIIGNAA